MQWMNDAEGALPPDALAGTMTEGEVALIVGVDRRTVRRWRSEGVLPFQPLPLPSRAVRFWRADVAKWLGRPV